jgi:small subunit ribosomal protein S6
MHPRRYETLLLLDPDLTAEELDQFKEKFLGIIDLEKGKLIRQEDWGRRRLSFPVHKQLYGHYLLMDFMGLPALLEEFERNLRIDERAWKYLTELKDKNFSEEKYTAEIERLQSEAARREAERAEREAERARRESDLQDRDGSGYDDDSSPNDDGDDDWDDDSDNNDSDDQDR